MQIFMEPLAGLDDLSLVRGYFKITGDKDRGSDAVQNYAQGIYFHKYGRVTMVTNEKQMYLKGSMFTMDDENVTSSRGDASERGGRKKGGGEAPKKPEQKTKTPVIPQRPRKPSNSWSFQSKR